MRIEFRQGDITEQSDPGAIFKRVASQLHD